MDQDVRAIIRQRTLPSMATTARGATRTRSRSSGAAASETSRQSTRGATLSPPEKFVGFSDEAIQFLLELQAEQSRTWFKVHQDDYVRLCRRPLELLVIRVAGAPVRRLPADRRCGATHLSDSA